MSDFDGSFGAIISNLFKDNGTKAAFCLVSWHPRLFSLHFSRLSLNQI